MGGFGSGKWQSENAKETTDIQTYLNINHLNKQKAIIEGVVGKITWNTCKRDQINSVVYHVNKESIKLYYDCCVRGVWVARAQDIPFVRQPCYLGGTRPFFLCPECGKKVGIIYGVGQSFLCRQCHNLTYTCQQENKHKRLARRAKKLRGYLGGDDNLLGDMPKRPRYMKKGFYSKMLEKAEDLRCQSLESLVNHFDTVVGGRGAMGGNR